VCICVCVCVFARAFADVNKHRHEVCGFVGVLSFSTLCRHCLVRRGAFSLLLGLIV